MAIVAPDVAVAGLRTHQEETIVPVLPWSTLFAVGVQEIDDQHRKLVGILNRLGEAENDAAAAAMQNLILDELTEYTILHFATEERLMQQHGYEASTHHIGEHHHLVDAVKALHARRAAGETLPFDELTTFLRDWLTNHIMGSDKALGLSLNRKGVY